MPNHQSRFGCRICIALGLFFSVVTLVVGTDDLRTWTDKTGKFKLEAKFVTIEDGRAVLEKSDGSRMKIDLEKLSPVDRKLAEQLHSDKDNPFQKATGDAARKMDDPFKRVPGRAGRRDNPVKDEPTGSDGPALMEIDWSGAKSMSLFGTEWKAPASSTVKAGLDWTPRPLALPPKSDFFEKASGIVANAQAKKAVVLMTLDRHGQQESAQGRLFWCDLEKGRVVKEFKFSGKFVPLALSHDGMQLVVRQEVFGHDNNDKIELWKISDAKLERTKRWRPIEHAQARGRDVNWVSFTNEGKTLLTYCSGGTLTWWSLADLKPVQTVQVQGGVSPALSADGKYLACCLNNELAILDSGTGEVIGMKPMERHLHDATLSFSPDNLKLACLTHQKLDIWNLSTGGNEASISLHGFQGKCFWTSNSAILAGNPLTYVDLGLQYPIWSYDGAEKVEAVGDYGLFLVADHQRKATVIFTSKLPHSAALQTVEQARKNPNFFLLKPGVKVKVDVSGIEQADIREEAEAALKKKLESNGNPVDDSAAVTFVASLKKGKDKEVSYRTFGMPLFTEGKKYTVEGWDYRLSLQASDKTHWETGGGTFPPPIIHLNQDETIESHLKKYGTPKADFFKHLELPKFVAHSQGGAIGSSLSLNRSSVTSTGFR